MAKSDEADVAAGHSTEENPMSKRQRRRLVNNKHKLPQMPKIQSPGKRAKAYIRVSGLSEQKKDVDFDLNDPSVRFGRFLGSADQRVRHQAVLQLESYLRQKCEIRDEDDEEDITGLSEMDLLKLWKALWHTLYMADKVPVQQELSKKLAKLIWCVAGTEEEDEYAAQVYLNMYGDNDVGFDDEYDEEDFTMEEIENTLKREVASESEESENDDDEEETKEEEQEEKEVSESDSDDDASESEESENGDDEEEAKEGEQEEKEVSESDSDDDENVNGGEKAMDEDTDENDSDEEDDMDNSEIPHCRGAHLASLFVRTFFHTVRREWGRMDKYRVDKFYSLIRMMMHQVFRYMSLRHWSRGIIRIFNDVIHEEVLSQTPNGLRYHLIDLTLEELAAVNAEAPMPLTEATFLDCLEPYLAMSSVDVGDATVKARVMENVLSKFLEEYSFVRQNPAKDEEGKPLTMDQVHVGTVAELIFELASDTDTPDDSREDLYEMHKKYLRAIKKAGKDVELGIEEGTEGPDDDHALMGVDSCDYKEVEEMEEESAEEVDSEKCSRKKKKKKKERGAGSDHEAIDGERPVTGQVDTSERPRKRKLVDKAAPARSDDSHPVGESQKTRKTNKKKKKRSDRADDREKSDRVAENPEQSPTPKKALDTRSVTVNTTVVHDDEVAEEDQGGKKKRKKKNKKSMEVTHGAAFAENGAGMSEDITISVLEQKAAKKAMKTANISTGDGRRVKPGGKEEKEVLATDGKRVKFGDRNMARSWKASMKGLRTMSPVSPLPKPDKGILYKKDGKTKVTKVMKIRARKRAADYF